MRDSYCIAIVSVLFNCEKHLPLFFKSMGQQSDKNYILILIDNASKDSSLKAARVLAESNGVPCEFIVNAANLGIAVGNNQGIERARDLGLKHVVLMNNDVGFEFDMISKIRKRAIEKGHKAWTCLAYYGDSKERWYGGGFLSYWLARGIHYTQAKSERIKEPMPVTYAPTCLMYLHMSVIDAVGMMDDQYFVYYDDTDFCRRLLDAGIELLYDPGVCYRHYVGGSSGGDLSPFFLRISTRNKFIYIRKHYRWPMRWIVLYIALFSKLTQLLNAQRRGPTWRGLMDALGGQ